MTTERKHGLGESPFHTADVILAFSLYLAGVPFFDDTRPCINIYDENILRKLGLIGISLEDGVKRAMATKKKGHVEYAFKRTAELNNILRVYKQQEDHLAMGEGTAVQEIHRLLQYDKSDGESLPPEQIIRLACTILKMRVHFASLWQQQIPLIRIMNDGEVETSADGMRKKFPGFRLVSLNASEATKARLNL